MTTTDTPASRNPLPSFRDYAIISETSGLSAPSSGDCSTTTETPGMSAPSYRELPTTQKTSAMTVPTTKETSRMSAPSYRELPTTQKTSAMSAPSYRELPTTQKTSSSDVQGGLPSPSDCGLCGRAGLAVLGAVLGACSGTVFALRYHNAHVAFWAFSTGALAALTLFVHVTHARGHYCKRRGRLLFLSFLGTTVSLCTALCLLFYLAMLVHLRQGFQLEGDGYLLAALWGVLSLLWSLQLTYFSRHYCRHPLPEARPLLLLPPSERGLHPAKMQGQCQYDSLEE